MKVQLQHNCILFCSLHICTVDHKPKERDVYSLICSLMGPSSITLIQLYIIIIIINKQTLLSMPSLCEGWLVISLSVNKLFQYDVI